MSEEAISADPGAEMSNEPLSTEIGSGVIAEEAISESGLAQEIDGASVDALASEVEAAVEDGASDEEIKELVETFKIKVNGQEKDITLDWNNKDDIIKRLQMAEGGQSAMQRASERERELEQTLQSIMDDPWSAMSELGLDSDALAEQRIQDRIAQLSKSPEQIAQDEREAELEELRQRLKSQEDEKEAVEFAKMQQDAEIDLDNQITDALSSTNELPKSPYVVKRIADAMLSAMENGQDDVSAKDVLPWVQKQINEEMQDLFSAMPDKLLEKYIGNKTIDRLRQGRLAKMNAPKTKIPDTGKIEKAEDLAKNVKLGDWLRSGGSIRDL